MLSHLNSRILAASGCSLALVLTALMTTRPARADQASTQMPSGVQIDLPADAPVRIVNFAFDRSPSGMTAFHYDVQNVSGQGMVAVEVRWQVQFGGQSANQAGGAIVNRDDRWLTGQLAAGASDHFQVTNVATIRDWQTSSPKDPQPSVAQRAAVGQSMSGLVGTVAYVELEDGSRTGSDAAKAGQAIDKARRAQLAATAKLLNVFGTGGNEALAHAIQQGSATGGEDAATQELDARMLGLLQDRGMDAVILELQRISALTIPESRE